ncbi:MAG TPA: VOC family protein [Methanoregulaceae archaeon]|nr:VOC family protein [Methanoregulaceae archaeon]HQJ87443.1 VOC family protein [Methanoregulaceae archaeon]
MPTIVHFDLPADDIGRAQSFYASLFGWTFERYAGPIEYYAIGTTNDDGTPGIGGGMGPRGAPGQQMMNYIGVPSVADYLARVEGLGGAVLLPRTTIPSIGYLAVCRDTEGNAFGLFEEDPGAG